MLRFASSLFSRRDRSKSDSDQSRQPPVSHIPYPSANSSASSATSLSVRTPDEPLDRQATTGPKGSSKWRMVFRSRKAVVHQVISSPSPPVRNDATPILEAESDIGLGSRLRIDQIPDGPDSDGKLVPPIRPFVYHHVDSSGSSTSSSRSSRSSLAPPTAQQHLHSMVIYSIQVSAAPSAHPLVYSPSELIYPRSCNAFDSPPSVQPTLRHQLLRARLLKRLETYTLTPLEERSIRPFVQRAPRSLRSQIPFSENEALFSVDGGGWSRGLNRWIRRSGFEDRNVIWVPNDDHTRLYIKAVTGRSIAALEFSEGLEALAGLQGDLLQSQSRSTVNNEVATPLQGGNTGLPSSLQPAYRRSSSTPSSTSSARTSSTPHTPTQPMSPPLPAAKRGVRFAPSIDSNESISEVNGPLVIVRPSSPAEEEVKTPRPRTRTARRDSSLSVDAQRPRDQRAHNQEPERQRLERERGRVLARHQDAQERERLRQQKRAEETRKQTALQERIAETRNRRESYKLDGGSSSNRALLSEKGLLNGDPFAPPITTRHHPTRSSTDPGKSEKRNSSGSTPPSPPESTLPHHQTSAPIHSSPLRPQNNSTGMLPNIPRGRRTSLLSTGTDKRSSHVPSEAWRLSSTSVGGYSDSHRLSKYGSPLNHQGTSDNTPSIPSVSHSSRLSTSNILQHNGPYAPPVAPAPVMAPNPFGMGMPMGMSTGMPMGPPMVVMQPVFVLPPQNATGGFPWMQPSSNMLGSPSLPSNSVTPGTPGSSGKPKTTGSTGTLRQPNPRTPGSGTPPTSLASLPPSQKVRRQSAPNVATSSSPSLKSNGPASKSASALRPEVQTRPSPSARELRASYY